LPWAARRADHIISVSEATKTDLIQLLKIPENRISVIYSSGHEKFSKPVPSKFADEVLSKRKIHEPYFICVGTMEPRKNFERIAEAFFEFSKKTKQKVQLVWVGSQDFAGGKFYESLLKRFSASEGQIVAAGYLEDMELGALYQRAQGLVFPSLYEGFGFPVLEAMGAGCPVLTSNTSSLPEVTGNAGLCVDPRSVESIARGMEILYSDTQQRQELVQAGFERLKLFSWQKTAQETLDLYRKVAHGC